MDSTEIVLLIGRMDGKLDEVLRRLDAGDKRLKEIDERVSEVEQTQTKGGGFIAGISVVVSGCVTVAGLVIGWLSMR